MESRLFCCCPFCSCNNSAMFSGKNWKLSWSAGLVMLLLLLGSCEAYHLRLPRSIGGEGTEVDVASDENNSQKLSFSQKLNSKPNDDRSCKGVGKCRPCSWLDINRKVPACLKSGFKQRSYCTSIKRERYTSCEYSPNSNELRRFWLFEGSAWSVGILAYAVVSLRNRKIEQRTARRIQAQINA